MNPFSVKLQWSKFISQTMQGINFSAIFKQFQILLFQDQKSHFLREREKSREIKHMIVRARRYCSVNGWYESIGKSKLTRVPCEHSIKPFNSSKSCSAWKYGNFSSICKCMSSTGFCACLKVTDLIKSYMYLRMCIFNLKFINCQSIWYNSIVTFSHHFLIK